MARAAAASGQSPASWCLEKPRHVWKGGGNWTPSRPRLRTQRCRTPCLILGWGRGAEAGAARACARGLGRGLQVGRQPLAGDPSCGQGAAKFVTSLLTLAGSAIKPASVLQSTLVDERGRGIEH